MTWKGPAGTGKKHPYWVINKRMKLSGSIVNNSMFINNNPLNAGLSNIENREIKKYFLINSNSITHIFRHLQ